MQKRDKKKPLKKPQKLKNIKNKTLRNEKIFDNSWSSRRNNDCNKKQRKSLNKRLARKSWR